MTKSDIEYNIIILQKMINELSPGVRELMSAQFDKLLHSFDKHNKQFIESWKKIKSYLGAELEDLELNIKYIEFDLISTRKERDDLQTRLNDPP